MMYCEAVKEAIKKMWKEECEKNGARLLNMKRVNETYIPSQDPKRNTFTLDSNPPLHSLDTLVFPTIELGPFDFVNDSIVTNQLFESAKKGSKIQLASGYFNLTEEYKSCILEKSKANYGILMAHPKVQ